MLRTPKDLNFAVPNRLSNQRHIQARRDKGLLEGIVEKGKTPKAGISYKYDSKNSLLYVASAILEFDAGLRMNEAFDIMRTMITDYGLARLLNAEYSTWVTQVDNGKYEVLCQSAAGFDCEPLPVTSEVFSQLICAKALNITLTVQRAIEGLNMSESELAELVKNNKPMVEGCN